jgi:hypothetical protein
MSLSIEIKGMDKIQAKLRQLEPRQYAQATMQACVTELKGYIAQYPPATDANNPYARKWYERGYGPRWHRADGSVGGIKSSQTLGRRWTTKVEDMGMRGTVGNNATYAPYVQWGQKQPWYHKRTGWRTVEDAIREKGPRIQEIWRRAIAKIMSM